MTIKESPRAARTWQTLALVILGLCLLGGAFLVGRRSAPTGSVTTEVRSGEATSHESGEAGGHAEEKATGKGDKEHAQEKSGDKPQGGGAKFTPEALAEAGIQIQRVGYTSVRSQLQVTGAVEPNLTGLVKVTPRVAGKILSLQVSIGDNVRAGQVLATMASTELAQAQAAYRQAVSRVAVTRNNLERQKKLAGLGSFGRPTVEAARSQATTAEAEANTAQNDVAAAQAQVSEAVSQLRFLQAALKQAETQVKVTQSRFDRTSLLLKDELVSRQDWEQAQADLQHAQADGEAARANIAQGQAKIETARANLQATRSRAIAARKRSDIASQALSREEAVYKGGYGTSKELVEAQSVWRQALLDERAAGENVRLLGGRPGGGNILAVSAPLAGRVTERLVTFGETVTPDKPLFTITNLKTVWVELHVDQKDLPAVRLGQTVSVSAETAPGSTFKGLVSYIGDVVDETTRTVNVRAVIENRGRVLRPQTFVRGRIATAVRAHLVAVPENAVQAYEGKTVVFVAGEHEGEFTPKVVKTGATTDGQTVITSGLDPGARVVTRGAFMVKAQAMKSELKDAD